MPLGQEYVESGVLTTGIIMSVVDDLRNVQSCSVVFGGAEQVEVFKAPTTPCDVSRPQGT
jgi:hypothetical protein